MKKSDIKNAAKNYRKSTSNQMYGDELGFEAGVEWAQKELNKYSHNTERMFTYEDMLKASQYGYNFHKTTSFPKQEFEDSCINNTKQWLTTFNK